MRELWTWTLACTMAVALSSCGKTHSDAEDAATVMVGGGFGQPCLTGSTPCRPGLSCDSTHLCQGTRGTPVGGGCARSIECAEGNYCAARGHCAPVGPGKPGDPCTTSGDCIEGAVCNTPSPMPTCVVPRDSVIFLADGTMYRGPDGPPGGDIADPCTTIVDCTPGLLCTHLVCTTP